MTTPSNLPADANRLPNRRFRVLAIATHPVQYQVPLFRQMARRDDLELQVAYCTLRGAEAAYDPEFEATIRWDIPLLDGYPWAHVPNRGTNKESFFGLRNSGLRKLIREGNFDAVLCYVSYTKASFWIAYFAAKSSGTAFLFGTDTITLSALDGKAWKKPIKRVLWPMLFGLADQVIVPSSGTRDLMRSLGLGEERVTLTPYVVDNDWWLARSSQIDRAAVRASWGVSDLDVVVLFCAKLQPWKRPSDLLQAFAKAKAPNAMLVIVGDGPLRASLVAEATSLGIGERVKFAGFANQTELPATYTAADLMVLPSVYDAFGVVVNEAMLCGCPVAASDHVGASRDLIEHGRTGYVFPCGDIDALASILRGAFERPKVLNEMGQAARARMDSWSPRQNIDATVDAVARGVKRVGRSPRRANEAVASIAADSNAPPAAKLTE